MNNTITLIYLTINDFLTTVTGKENLLWNCIIREFSLLNKNQIQKWKSGNDGKRNSIKVTVQEGKCCISNLLNKSMLYFTKKHILCCKTNLVPVAIIYSRE
jgi:hypothetical protein